MTNPTVPPGIPSLGSLRAWYVPAMANPAAPSIASDLGAAGAVELTCLCAKGGFTPQVLSLKNLYRIRRTEQVRKR